MRKQKKLLFLLFLVFCCGGILFLTVTFVNYFFREFIVSKPIRPPRHANTSETVELLWGKSVTSWPVTIDNGIKDSKEPFLHIKDNDLILPVWELDNLFTANVSLISYDLTNGNLKWRHVLSRDGSTLAIGKSVDSIFTISNKCARGDQKCGNSEIAKHNLATGEIFWSVQHSDVYPTSALSIDQNKINVVGHYAGMHFSEHSIDTETGEFLSEFSGIEHDPASFSISYGTIPKVLGYEPHEIVGNIVSFDNYLAFLAKKESSLLIVDKDSREIVGSVKFSGSPFSLRANDFKLAANDNIVAVYLGDSEQLFAFKFVPTNS